MLTRHREKTRTALHDWPRRGTAATQPLVHCLNSPAWKAREPFNDLRLRTRHDQAFSEAKKGDRPARIGRPCASWDGLHV